MSSILPIDALPPPLPGKAVFKKEDRIASLMGQVIQDKEANVQKALDNTRERYSPSLIGGDVLNFGYFILLGLQNIFPSLLQVATLGIAIHVLGEVGGVVNIFVGLISLRESIRAMRTKNYLLAARLFSDFVCYSLIGIIMTISSISIRMGICTVIGAVFAAHPWLLPTLFFIASVPLALELCYRIKKSSDKKDLGSELDFDKMFEGLLTNSLDPATLLHLDSSKSDLDLMKNLRDLMEKYQAELGPEAAVKIFQLFRLLQNKDPSEIIDKIQEIQEKIKEWNDSLYLRAFEQAIFLCAFVVCMATFGINSQSLYSAQNGLLALGNGLAIYIDAACPFKRNTPIVVAKIDLSNSLLGNTPKAVNA